jgi:N-acetylneuraminate synthase
MTFIIGEIGINHNGSLNLAKKLIKIAKKFGFDSVKFQKRNPEITTPKKERTKLKETPWGVMTYLDYKKKIEFGRKEYDEINSYCKKINIKWFASAWDVNSLNFLDKYKLKYNKVASAMLTNIPLIQEIAKRKIYTFISTGGASIEMIKKVVEIFDKNKCSYLLMHSVSIYPCPDKMLNLQMIKVLRDKFKCPVGYSGHESSLTPSLVAVSLGAEAIERHITLDRTLWGSDQAASLGPDGMKDLVSLSKKIKIVIGDGVKRNLNKEKKKISQMIYW